MGASISSYAHSDHGHSRSRSQQIESSLRKDQTKAQNEIKMLLLGAGDSGKSTILKQMKLIHHGPYSLEERSSFKEVIYYSTIQSMRAIIEALPLLSLSLPESCSASVDIVNSSGGIWTDDVIQALRQLWDGEGSAVTREAVSRSNEFQLNDSAIYYLQKLDVMAMETWEPTEMDILRSRVKTTGITETIFQVYDLTYRLFDVGGQRSERKKWIHCFENVTSLVFLVSLSEYDQVLYEDSSVNRMQEALTLFAFICNSKWFVQSNIILFLNKTDLFKAKLPVSPLSNYFPEYKGGADYDRACEFVKNKFIAANRNPTKQIFTHYTCATDTQHIKFVLSTVQNVLLRKHLKTCGIV